MGEGRYRIGEGALAEESWQLGRRAPPSRLFGANGIRAGADGRLYVAQVAGSQVSAIDVDSGDIETICPMGGAITGPDDLAFDEAGNLYITEVTADRVSMRASDGKISVIHGNIPVANPITWHRGHLITAEFHPQGRIVELNREGGDPRVILDDVPMVNAFEFGPDGKLYFPMVSANAIGRVALDGSGYEIVAGDLGHLNSVKFDAQGFIVSTNTATGQLLRIDPRTGDRTVLAQMNPGLDNCAFLGSRLFVSSISGQVTEILGSGQQRIVLPDGLQWPMGLAVDGEGTLFAADGGFSYLFRPGERRALAGMHFTPNYPGFVRGVAAAGGGEWIVTTARGELCRFWPAESAKEVLARDYDRLTGVAIAPRGAILFADSGTGQVRTYQDGNTEEIGTALDRPMGVAVDSEGHCYVAEAGKGRIVKLAGDRWEVVADALIQPEGIALLGGRLHTVDVAAKAVIEIDLVTGARQTIASGLPVGAPPGETRKELTGLGTMTGAWTPFTGLAAGPDGTLYVSADADGGILTLRSGS